MNNSHKLTAVGMTLLLAAIAGRAQSTDRLYVNLDAGVALQSDVAIEGGTGFVGPGGNLKFDTGYRVGAELGYNLNSSFAVELEAGLIMNDINLVGIQKLSDVGASAELDEIPLLVGGVYKFPLKGDFKPYVGVAVGAMAGVLDSSRIPGSATGGRSTYADTDFTFAYQGELGFKYSLSKHVALGLAYKFTGTTEHGWTDNNINLKAAGTMTHSIEAAVTWDF